jgi:hypothetical protein
MTAIRAFKRYPTRFGRRFDFEMNGPYLFCFLGGSSALKEMVTEGRGDDLVWPAIALETSATNVSAVCFEGHGNVVCMSGFVHTQ